MLFKSCIKLLLCLGLSLPASALQPDHDELCHREQLFLLNAIQNDVDLTDHMDDAINSMKIVAAADKSFRTGEIIHL